MTRQPDCPRSHRELPAASLDDLDLNAILHPLLEEHPATVAAWLRNEPGSWGALAGQAILAVRRALGRGLSEAERRVVWQAMWDQLGALRRG